jgi:O-methyltransferase
LKDILGTRANASFLEDDNFNNAYSIASSISRWGGDIRWRIYNIIKFAGYSLKLDGDFVECGVDRGGSCMALLSYYPSLNENRKVWLFDTFEGLITDQLNENERKFSPFLKESYAERYPPIYEVVKETFSTKKNINIIKGVVPESLSNFDGEKVAFLHIDMNVALPEVAALNFFWDHLVNGAIIILDDYGFPLHTEQKEAIDKWSKNVDANIVLMPTGQGLIIKNY